MAESEQMLFLSGVKWLKWRPERSSYLQTIVSIHMIAPHPWLFQWFFFIAWEIVSLRWWKWHPDHFYIQATVSIRTSQFWSDRWHFFLFNQPKIFWNLLEYAEEQLLIFSRWEFFGRTLSFLLPPINLSLFPLLPRFPFCRGGQSISRQIIIRQAPTSHIYLQRPSSLTGGGLERGKV